MKVSLLFVAFWISAISTQVQAGLLDDLLKNPAIQNLLNRNDLPNLASNCKNAAFRNANQTQCVNAENAMVINKLPSEMRAIMSNQQSANSLRELCGQAQNSPRANSYLCSQLRSAEAAIGVNSSIPVAPAPEAPHREDRG